MEAVKHDRDHLSDRLIYGLRGCEGHFIGHRHSRVSPGWFDISIHRSCGGNTTGGPCADDDGPCTDDDYGPRTDHDDGPRTDDDDDGPRTDDDGHRAGGPARVIDYISSQ